jgi:hypothetical protein
MDDIEKMRKKLAELEKEACELKKRIHTEVEKERAKFTTVLQYLGELESF